MTGKYIPYSDDVEARHPDEDQIFEAIAASMRRISLVTLDRYRHAVRPSHAKSHGLLKGEMVVLDGLPEELCQGLFAAPGTFPILARLSSVPGDILDDSVTTQRGMALKVIGIESARMLPGHESEVTQDFLLDNDPRFPVPDAVAFLATLEGLEKTTERVEPLKKAVSAAARGANAVLRTVGLDRPNLDFFGHPPVHPLADTYYSQAPLRYGAYVAKISVAPVSDNLEALKKVKPDIHNDFSALREAIVSFFNENTAEYELRVQLCTDLKTMPVEDASIPWPEEISPYRPVARLRFPAQNAYSPARRVHFDDVLAFSPAHGLADHRPLGSIMRARLRTYGPLAELRRDMNRQPRVEPRSIDEIPD